MSTLKATAKCERYYFVRRPDGPFPFTFASHAVHAFKRGRKNGEFASHRFGPSIAGAGNLDGVGDAARFTGPLGLSIDNDGNAYVVEAANNVVRKVTPAGVVSRLAGTGERGSLDGDGAFAQFSYPSAAALDRQRGVLYVAGAGGGQGLRRVTVDGKVSTITDRILPPRAVAVGPDGSVYFSAGSSFTGLVCCDALAIYNMPALGGAPVLLAGSPSQGGSVDGNGGAARFGPISSLAVDAAGNAYAVDGYTIRKVTAPGQVSTLAGAPGQSGFVDGVAGAARFGLPYQVAVHSSGDVLVWDGGNRAVRRVTAQGEVRTVTRNLPALSEIALDGADRIFFSMPHAVGRIDADGTARVIAGTPEPDGGTALPGGYGMVVDSKGNVFTTLAPDNVRAIRKYAPSGVVVPFGLGSGDLAIPTVSSRSQTFGSTLAIDASDNLYEAQSSFSGSWSGTIYRISPAGQFTTLVSTQSGAGPFSPVILTASKGGTVFFVDGLSNALLAVDAAGKISKVVDLPASLGPSGWQWFDLAASEAGVVYMTDMLQAVVYRITPGVLAPFAGRQGGYGALDGQGGQTLFTRPTSPAVDSAGNLWLKDGPLVRKITADRVVSTVAGHAGQYGTQLGALPGNLSDGPLETLVLRERLAIGPDDVIYVESDKAIVKIRLK
jgi:hypothetical protein